VPRVVRRVANRSVSDECCPDQLDAYGEGNATVQRCVGTDLLILGCVACAHSDRLESVEGSGIVDVVNAFESYEYRRVVFFVRRQIPDSFVSTLKPARSIASSGMVQGSHGVVGAATVVLVWTPGDACPAVAPEQPVSSTSATAAGADRRATRIASPVFAKVPSAWTQVSCFRFPSRASCRVGV
jgi:hypothetical protein